MQFCQLSCWLTVGKPRPHAADSYCSANLLSIPFCIIDDLNDTDRCLHKQVAMDVVVWRLVTLIKGKLRVLICCYQFLNEYSGNKRRKLILVVRSSLNLRLFVFIYLFVYIKKKAESSSRNQGNCLTSGWLKANRKTIVQLLADTFNFSWTEKV